MLLLPLFLLHHQIIRYDQITYFAANMQLQQQ